MVDTSRFFEFHNAVRKHHPDLLWGSGEPGLHALTHVQTGWTAEHGNEFEESLTASVPWEQAPTDIMRRLDPAVRGSWPSAPMEEVDPANLKASQRALTGAGMRHYFGATDFAQLHDVNRGPSNLHPIVYRSTDPAYPHDILLSGHHRAAASLLMGRPLRALVVTGGLLPR